MINTNLPSNILHLPVRQPVAPSRSLQETSWRHAWTTVKRWYRNHRERWELAHLDPHLLADIGLTRTGQQHEVKKPFWID